jgi:hypothetical protein
VPDLLAPAACCLSLVCGDGDGDGEGDGEGAGGSLALQCDTEARRDLWASALSALWEHRGKHTAWRETQTAYFPPQTSLLEHSCDANATAVCRPYLPSSQGGEGKQGQQGQQEGEEGGEGGMEVRVYACVPLSPGKLLGHMFHSPENWKIK